MVEKKLAINNEHLLIWHYFIIILLQNKITERSIKNSRSIFKIKEILFK